MFGPPIPLSELSSPTPDDIQSILASCTSPGDDEMARTIKEDTLTNEDEQQQRQEQQESPGRTFSIRTVPNLNASLEQDSDIDWAGAHLQAGMQTGSESAAMSSGYNQFAHPPARQHLLSEEMSARTLNSAGNSSFHSANSSVTGLTSVPAHVLASNTAINREGISARSRQPIDYSRWEIDYRPRDSASPSPSPQRVYPAPDDFLSEEDRQLEADMRRAIELSLSESQRSRPTAVPAITAAVPAPATTATAEIAVTEQAPASPLVAPLQREGSFQKQRPPAPSSLVRALSERSDTADATRHSQSATAIGAAAGAVTPATAAAVMVEVNAKVSADYVSGGAGGSANLSRPHSAVGNGAADGDNGITQVKRLNTTPFFYIIAADALFCSCCILLRFFCSFPQHTRMIGTPERNRATRSQMSSNNSTVGTSLGGTANLVGAGSIVMHDSLSDAQVLQVEQVSETSERVPSAGRQTAQELSTTMPAAGAFTTYGNRKSSTNLQQQHLLQEDIVSSAKDKVFEKENRTDGLGSKKGDSPHSMMRNSTTIDLETAPEAAYLTHQQHH